MGVSFSTVEDMAKVGRNQPCPCGSGKKYKQCCLAQDEAAANAALSAVPTGAMRHGAEMLAELAAEYAALEILVEDSNAVVDMIQAGRLDEAEHAAHQLLNQYPDAHDGYDRLGMIYEARGDNARAADSYRKALAVARDNDEPELEQVYRRLINKLDPTDS